jgi:hypothetical protein
MRPFGGAVFAAKTPPAPYVPRGVSRDINGYSAPLRMAIYTTNLVPHPKFIHLLPVKTQIDILYLLLLTAELASDQIDLAEDGKLFESHLDYEALAGVRRFLSDCHRCITSCLRGPSTHEDWHSHMPHAMQLVDKFLAVGLTATPTAFYAAKALSHLLPRMVEDVHVRNSSEWLVALEQVVTKPGPAGVAFEGCLNVVAIMVGLQDHWSTSRAVSNFCNRLMSDVAVVSSQAENTLALLIKLNATLAVYEEVGLPVAQNRIVFAVQQILSWTPTLATTDSQLASEACVALQTLLPSMKEVYGSYWETTLNFCISIWDSTKGDLTVRSIPVVGMSLKLFTILRNLTETNDDLEEALTVYAQTISQSLVNLLKLQRSKESKPLEFVDDILSRNIRKIPIEHIKDLSEFYPLVASDFRQIQSTAFDVLHRAIPEAQQQISVDVLLEKTGRWSRPYSKLTCLIHF